jgi:FkbM family methyltransferase
VFERLRENYKGDERFIFENVAIDLQNGKRNFWYLSETLKTAAAQSEQLRPLPFWFDQLGSFDRSHILKHFRGRERAIEPFIVEEEVSTATLNDVLTRHDVARLDLVHIDTEGFDYQVLKQIDFVRYRPRAILYEHLHLSPHEQAAARHLLATYQYRSEVHGPDTLACAARDDGPFVG